MKKLFSKFPWLAPVLVVLGCYGVVVLSINKIIKMAQHSSGVLI